MPRRPAPDLFGHVPPAKPTPKTGAQRQAAYRARKAAKRPPPSLDLAHLENVTLARYSILLGPVEGRVYWYELGRRLGWV